MTDYSSPLDADFATELNLSRQDAANLRKAGKWGRFLGIVSMVFIGITLLFVVFSGSTFLALAGMGDGGVLVTVMLAVYAAAILLLFYLSYLLYQFGSRAVIAVDNSDPASTSQSLASLARLFKIYGILTIVYLGFFAFAMAASVFAGAGAFLGS